MKWLRNNAPIIMIGYNLLNAIAYYLIDFEIYSKIYPYLTQTVGYSFFTTLVFIGFYFNRYYCNSIKIAVIGLIVMNVATFLCYIYDADSFVYDIYIGFTTIVVYYTYKKYPLKNKKYV